MKDDTAMRSTISFVAIGCFRYMQEVLYNKPKKYEFLVDTYGGQIGVVDMVTQHAHLIEKAWKRKKNKDIDYVWEYDVSEEFGYVTTANLADEIQLNPAKMIQSIIDELDELEGV